MAIKITIAKSPEVLDDVFKFRHHVFVEQMKVGVTHINKRIFDRFDAYPTSRNLVVTEESKVVGCMRLTMDSRVWLPLEQYFNFRAHIASNEHLMSCDMYCEDTNRKDYWLAVHLLLMASYYGISHGATYLVSAMDANIAHLFNRIGFKIIGDEFTNEVGQKVVPIMLDILKANDSFLYFAQQNQLMDFLGEYERVFFDEGEYLIQAEENSNHAFFIIDGVAEVRFAHTNDVVNTLKEGDLVGELAMLTDEPRSANVIAATKVIAMTLSKEVFLKTYSENPDQALKLLRFMAARTNRMNRLLHEKMAQR